MEMSYSIRRLGAADIAPMRDMLAMFGEAFDERDTYTAQQPSDEYLRAFLGDEHKIALAAFADGAVVAGIVAYVLQKFESERSEIYIYDLAVADAYRRLGVATKLIEFLKKIASEVGSYVIFVQADPPDAPAVALYEKLGTREDVYHYDITPASRMSFNESNIS